MTRPLIGITGSHDRATWDIWVDDVVLVPAAYTKAVERAGGQPVVIPPGDCDSSLVEKLDGLVVAGGADLNPGTYGEAPVPETADWRDRQDASEQGLVAAVLERDLDQPRGGAGTGLAHRQHPGRERYREFRPPPGRRRRRHPASHRTDAGRPYRGGGAP